MSSRNMYSRARVRRVDAIGVRAGVPVVDRGVVLHARDRRTPRRPRRSCSTGRAPCSVLARPRRSCGSTCCHSPSFSTALHERVGHAHRVVRVLAGDGVVGLAVEVATSSRPRSAPRPSSLRAPSRWMKSTISGWSMSRQTILAARRVVPPDLVAPARAIEHLEEAHQARRRAAARELFLRPRIAREVRARARAVLEEARLVLDELEDAHQVVVDRLDEAGRALRVLVGVRRSRRSCRCSGRPGVVAAASLRCRSAGRGRS